MVRGLFSCENSRVLDAINVVSVVTATVVRVDIIELNVIVSLSSELDGLVDLDRLRELAIGLQIPGLVSRVLQDNVSLGVLELRMSRCAQRQ